MKRKRLVSAVLACAMTVGLTSLPAVAAEAPTEAEVTEMTVGENTVFVYAPERDMVYLLPALHPALLYLALNPILRILQKRRPKIPAWRSWLLERELLSSLSIPRARPGLTRTLWYIRL